MRDTVCIHKQIYRCECGAETYSLEEIEREHAASGHSYRKEWVSITREVEVTEHALYRCSICGYEARGERSMEEHVREKHEDEYRHRRDATFRPVLRCDGGIYSRYRKYVKDFLIRLREERSRATRRRAEKEYERFRSEVYEAFTTFAARYFSYARDAEAFINQMLEAGAPAWRLPMLYQFLDDEPVTERDPELATLTWKSLLLLMIPTFPSGRYDNRIEKVHVIAVEVLPYVYSEQIIAHRKLLRVTIAERVPYEIDSITHIVFALDGENNTYPVPVFSSEIPNYCITPLGDPAADPARALQAKPLASNYITEDNSSRNGNGNGNKRIKRLIVGDARHTLVFIGRNMHEKIVTALHILASFYASKVAGMLHDDALTTSKHALKVQMLQRSWQNYWSIRYYGVMDDVYTTKVREEAVLNSVLTRATFLRLLSAMISIREVMRAHIKRLKHYLLEMGWRLTEILRDQHAKLVNQECRLLESAVIPYSSKRASAFLADEVYFARAVLNVIRRINSRMNESRRSIIREAVKLSSSASASVPASVPVIDEVRSIPLADECSMRGVMSDNTGTVVETVQGSSNSISSRSSSIGINSNSSRYNDNSSSIGINSSSSSSTSSSNRNTDSNRSRSSSDDNSTSTSDDDIPVVDEDYSSMISSYLGTDLETDR